MGKPSSEASFFYKWKHDKLLNIYFCKHFMICIICWYIYLSFQLRKQRNKILKSPFASNLSSLLRRQFVWGGGGRHQGIVLYAKISIVPIFRPDTDDSKNEVCPVRDHLRPPLPHHNGTSRRHGPPHSHQVKLPLCFLLTSQRWTPSQSPGKTTAVLLTYFSNMDPLTVTR